MLSRVNSWLGRQKNSKGREMFESKHAFSNIKIANSEYMQAAITQAAIQAASVVVKGIRKADPTTELHTKRKSPEDKLDQH